jgi:hypothetical protein
MARVQNPTLFSTYFNLDSDMLAVAGLIDPFVDVDTQLFIDPVLLEKSHHPKIANDAIDSFRKHFSNFIRLLTICKREGDPAWVAAQRLLDLTEPPENGLGYGGSGRSGSSRPTEVQHAIMTTAQEIIELGSSDPEMISLMGFFEENVGPDTISDFTTRVIIEQLAGITAEFCSAHGILLKENPLLPGLSLPCVKGSDGKERFVVLVPRDIVRELPSANDWGDIEAAALASANIRQGVNSMLAAIAQPTVADRKEALRRAALESPQSFAEFLAAVKEHVKTYDPNLDALAYYKMKSIFAHGFEDIRAPSPYDVTKGPEEINRLVHDTIALFKQHVENGNLWEELWIDDKPKKERAAQLIYYAIADAYCRANNVDLSPEANMGGGPIDFKFSSGYWSRVLVEMKRSSGTVRHGYEKQLEFYKAASATEFAIFVVMNFGDLGDKLDQILELQARRKAAGQRASDIVVIDAMKKASSSKRQ